MGHPDAAYDLAPDAQARLLGWMLARTSGRSDPGGKGGTGQKVLDGEDLFNPATWARR